MKEDLKSGIGKKAAEVGKESVNIAALAVKLYFILPLAGFFLGVFGAYFYADYAGYGFWLSAAAMIGGVVLGPLLGLLAAWLAVAGMIDDLVFRTGWDASKAGFAFLKKTFRKGDAEKGT